MARDEHRRERRAEVFAVREPDRLDRLERRQRPRGPDRQSGGPQHADEMDDVFREAAFRRERHAPRGGPSRFRAASVTAALLPPALPRRGALPPRGERSDVVLVLEEHARGIGDRLRIERNAVERDQCSAQSSVLAAYTFSMTVGPGVPADVKTVADFIRWAKANPDKANYGIPAPGSVPHFIGMMF